MKSTTAIALVAALLLLIPGCVNGVSWLPDSSGFILTTDRGRLVHYDVATKATRVLVEDTKSNTYWPAVSPDGNRIAVARLGFEEKRKARLQVVVYDRKGQMVLESKSLAFGVLDKDPGDESTMTQLFWDPSGKKLLIYGNIHGTSGTTGLYDVEKAALTIWERTIPSTYGVTPLRPDGKGFLLTKIGENGEEIAQLSSVDWQGQLSPLTARFDLKNDKLAKQLAWPVLCSSEWADHIATATTPAGRTRIDTIKGEATLQAVAPAETTLGDETIWMKATLSSGIQVIVLTPAKEKETYHKSRTIAWDPKTNKQLAVITEAGSRLVGLFPSPDRKHVLLRVREGDRRGPGADLMYVINTQGQLVDTVDVFDRFLVIPRGPGGRGGDDTFRTIVPGATQPSAG